MFLYDIFIIVLSYLNNTLKQILGITCRYYYTIVNKDINIIKLKYKSNQNIFYPTLAMNEFIPTYISLIDKINLWNYIKLIGHFNIFYRICNFAAKYNHLDFLMWLTINNYPHSVNLMEQAIIGGNLNICIYIYYKISKQITHIACYYAGEYGHLHIIQWLYYLNLLFIFDCCSGAIHNNQFNVLNWLVSMNIFPWHHEGYLISAINNQNIQLLDWYINNNQYISKKRIKLKLKYRSILKQWYKHNKHFLK